MNPIQLKIVNPLLLKWGSPIRQSDQAAGYDLHACIPEKIKLPTDATLSIPTGIALHLDDPNLAAMIYARSGLALKSGVTLANGVGVVDADYQGEISVLLRNESWEDVWIRPGDRIAQLVFTPIAHPPMSIVVAFAEDTPRGKKGFGSTGAATPVKGEIRHSNDMGII